MQPNKRRVAELPKNENKREFLRIKRRISGDVGYKEMIREITAAPSPERACRTIAKLGLDEACAVIDSLDPLTGAIAISWYRTSQQDASASKEFRAQALHIVKRAEELGLEATKGLCHARNVIYEKYGIFAGL